MSVHTTKDGRHYVKYYLPGERSTPKKKYFGRGPDAKLAAQQWDIDFKRKKRRGEILPDAIPAKAALTFEELTQRYLDEKELAVNSGKAIVQAFNNYLGPTFGRKPVKKLTMADLADLNAKLLAKDLSVSTRNRYRAYARAICQWGFDNDLVQANPFARFKPNRKKEGKAPDLITDEEIQKIWEHAADHLRWAIYCEMNLGVRAGVSELFKIRMADVDFKAGGVWVTREKTDSQRELIPVKKEFLEALVDLKKREPRRKYLVEYQGRPVTTLKTAWWNALRRAGIYESRKTERGMKHKPVKEQKRRIRLTEFRHRFATMLLAGGADLKGTSRLLGHSSPSTTLTVYAHVIEDRKRDAIDRLSLPDLDLDRGEKE